METDNNTNLDKSQTLPPQKMYDEMDFYELMEANVNDFHTRRQLVEGIVRNAIKGDSNSQKIVERIMMEAKFKNEQKLIVTDGQLRDIITLAADRIRGQGPLSTASGTY